MKRALFLATFKRMLVPTVVSALFVATALWMLQTWFPPTKDIVESAKAIDALGMAVLAILGFFTGRGAFPLELKQRGILFLETLPSDRLSLWAIVYGGNLCAALASLAVFALLRPSLFLHWPSSLPAYALLFYLCCFAIGACSALLFRTAPAGAAAGFAGSWILLGLVFLLATAFVSHPSNTRLFPIPIAEPSLHAYFGFGLAILAALNALLAYGMFSRGELHLPRVRIKNGAIYVASHLFALAALGLSQDSGIFTARDEWRTDAWYASSPLTGDGRYLAVVERRRNHPQFARVAIVEVSSGRIVSRTEVRGAIAANWCPDGTVLVPVADDAPLGRIGYLLPASDLLVWLAPDGREVRRLRLRSSSILDAFCGASGLTVLAAGRGSSARILFAGTGAESLSELASGTLRSRLRAHASLSPIRDGQVAAIGDEAWIVRSTAEKLAISAGAVPFIVGSTPHMSAREAIADVAKTYPFPPTPDGVGTHVLSGWPYSPNYFDDGCAIFYLRSTPGATESELWRLQRPQGTWHRLTANSPILPASLEQAVKVGLPVLDPQHLMPGVGLAAYLVRGPASVDAYLFDEKIGDPLALGSLPAGGDVRLYALPDFRGVAVRLLDAQKTASVTRQFGYRPGSGKLVALPAVSDTIFWAGPSGEIVFLRDKTSYWFADSKGAERRLWPPTKEGAH